MRLVPLFLLILIFPVLGAETVTKDNFAEPNIKVNDRTYIPNETTIFFKANDYVTVRYLIEPKTEDDAKKIDDRDYYLYTDLEDVEVKCRIVFKNGASLLKEGLTVEVEDADNLDGIDYIEVNLSGYVPKEDIRFEELYALKIRVQDGGYILPSVIIYIKNDEKFLEDLKNAKERYDELSHFLANYTGKVEVSNLEKYLDLASRNLTIAEENFNEKDYINADKRLRYAEELLNNASKESEGIEVRYKFSQVDERIRELKRSVDEIKVYIGEIERKDLLNTSVLIDYKVRYEDLEDRLVGLINEKDRINNYISIGRYEDAKRDLESIINKLGDVESEANVILNELKPIIMVTPTTSTPTPTTQTDLSSFVYAGIVGGCVAVVFIAVMIFRRYMKRRRWDELR